MKITLKVDMFNDRHWIIMKSVLYAWKTQNLSEYNKRYRKVKEILNHYWLEKDLRDETPL